MAFLTDSLAPEDLNTMQPLTIAPPSLLCRATRMDDLLSALPRLAIPFGLTTPPTFTVFQKLLSEMRHRIWRMVAFEPRIVKLVPYNLAASQRLEGQFQHPPMLHTPQDARREGLRYYRKCMQKCCDIRTHLSNVPCRKRHNIIYANDEVDSFQLGIYDRYVANDGKLAFDWKVIPWGGFNLRTGDMRPIKRLHIELYCSTFPNPIKLFRDLKPLRNNVKLEECTFDLKRWNRPQKAVWDTVNFNYWCENFTQSFRHLQQIKGLDFAINLKFRSNGEWYDLFPATSVLLVTSKSASQALPKLVDGSDGKKSDVKVSERSGDELEDGDATGA